MIQINFQLSSGRLIALVRKGGGGSTQHKEGCNRDCGIWGISGRALLLASQYLLPKQILVLFSFQ